MFQINKHKNKSNIFNYFKYCEFTILTKLKMKKGEYMRIKITWSVILNYYFVFFSKCHDLSVSDWNIRKKTLAY